MLVGIYLHRALYKCQSRTEKVEDKALKVHPLFSFEGDTQESGHGQAARINLSSSYLTVSICKTQPPNMCKEVEGMRLGRLAGTEMKKRLNMSVSHTSILSFL